MSYISASGLSYKLPDTTILFSDLNFTFNRGPSAIVGKNGVGKTTLFRLIQNQLSPAAGAILNKTKFEVLPQDLDIFRHQDILDVLGVKRIYTAYLKIISGDYNESCYEDLNNRWDIENEINHSLSSLGLDKLDLKRSFSSLSGGEKIRLLLSKILINKPDFFLLDEPTNNLDNESRQYIYTFITEWKKGLVVISHDRTLLELMDHIYELTPKGIKHYMGNFTFYTQQKEIENNKLQQDIVTASKNFKKAKKIGEESLRKHEKRAKVGKKNGKSLPPIVANKWKNSSENSFGSLNNSNSKKVEIAKEQYDSLAEKKGSSLKIRVDLLGAIKHKNKILVKAESINFTYSKENIWNDDLSFIIRGREKILLTGKNGSGKSTLCKIITGELSPVKGDIDVNVHRISILDQSVSCLDGDLTLLENIQSFAKPDIPEHKLRIILGGFLFFGDDVFKKATVLSGGEKMRLAMACIFSVNNSSELLILDEPTNNMDLESIDQLTQSVKEYPGALIVISHDEYFVKEIGIDITIEL